MLDGNLGPLEDMSPLEVDRFELRLKQSEVLRRKRRQQAIRRRGGVMISRHGS